jgi:hypothetical protein
VGCASIPAGRYGVSNVAFRGVDRMDEQSLAACLGTRERSSFGIDFGLRGTPECGEAPFDADHLLVELWSWPWSDWPLFDESVFERDVERIERWYRARGFYEARVVATEVEPPAATATDGSSTTCGSGEDDCTVDVTFSVEEGEPVIIDRMSVRGIDDLPEGMRERLRGVLQFSHGDRFDEALFEDTKNRMLRVLADAGFAHAVVSGAVKINRGRRETFIVFTVEAGLPNVIGRVCVSGYGELPPQPILAVAGLDAGATFSLRLLEGTQRDLYALGVFSGVEVAPRREEAPEPESLIGAESGDGPPVVSAEDAEVQVGEEHEVCSDGPTSIPAGTEPVDILLRVTPGRITRVGFGLGLQAGQAVTFGTVTSFANQQNAAQWDLHLSASFEHRNLFDNLIRARLEVRPRLIFDMPVFNFTSSQSVPVGIQTTANFRWPAFLERRTNLIIQVRHDLGPMPFTGFFRSELDGFLGPERTFFDGRLYGGIFVHGNWFVPTDVQPLEPRDQLPETFAVWLEEALRLDLRDDPRNPTAGAYFAVNAQQSVQPLSSWDLLGVHGEARGYIPLPAGIVIAARFEIGAMEVLGAGDNLDPDNVYQLRQLGPTALQLRGGGASSNRGYLPGLLGDATQVYVSLPRTPDEIAAGAPIRQRPVRISGGTRMWGASLEVRIPITQSFGVVAFGDAGDVSRPSVLADNALFRFDHPQISVGLGLRYRTIIGPVRLDVAWAPQELQTIGVASTLPRTCQTDRASNCNPRNELDLGFVRFPGAFHLTIGESF